MTDSPHILSNQALELVAGRFRILGEPNRLRLIQALRDRELNVSELVEKCGLTQANASKHLATLTDGKILGRRKEGLNVIYFIADPTIFDLCEHVCGSIQRNLLAGTSAFASSPETPPAGGSLESPPVNEAPTPTTQAFSVSFD